MGNQTNILEVERLKKYYPVRRGVASLLKREKDRFVKAVDGISFAIKKGEILSLAGESGSGKTTTGEVLALLQDPTEGAIVFEGNDISNLKGHQRKEFRKKVQVIFQDPYETLNPRFSVYSTIAEPLEIHGMGDKTSRFDAVINVLESVGLRPPEMFLSRYPHELSGGQRQRVAIARSMVLSPTFIVADEPTSMLDVSVRASILNLLKDLKDRFNLTMLYISHDFSTIWYLADRTAIMYLGKIMEIGPTNEIIENPQHPYTKALISAVATIDRNRERVDIKGEIPDAITMPEGCRFHPRCSARVEKCHTVSPELTKVSKDHAVACLLCSESN